jgi:ferritin-like metal-binding protein YciE
MPNKKNTPDTLDTLLLNKLKTLYDVEIQLVKALPKMVKKSTDAGLKEGFEDHLRQTENHVDRLDRAFKVLGVKPQKLQSEAIRGLIADAEWVIKNVHGEEALDANLIAAAQYVEHYEIAGYGAAFAWAQLLGRTEIAELLEQTLHEEEETADALNDLAAGKINEAALGESEGEEQEEDDEEDGDEK